MYCEILCGSEILHLSAVIVVLSKHMHPLSLGNAVKAVLLECDSMVSCTNKLEKLILALTFALSY